MISNGKVTGAQLESYYTPTESLVEGQEAVTTSDDYYSKEGIGIFHGDGLRHWGFDTSGDMKEQIIAFTSNRKDTERNEKIKDKDGNFVKDENGKFKTELVKSSTQKGTDFTFSPPKSVSIVWGKAIQDGNKELAAAIEKSHRELRDKKHETG